MHRWGVGLYLIALATPAWVQNSAQPWKIAVQKAFLSKFHLTEASFDRNTIVSAGTVAVLKKGQIGLSATSGRIGDRNIYTDGVLKPELPYLLSKRVQNGEAKMFGPGDRFWVTKIAFEPRGSNVYIELLTDPYDDVRYWGLIRVSFPKDAPPDPEQFMTVVARILDSVEPGGGPQAAPASQPAPQRSPPGPAPTIEIGQTIEQVVAIMGEPAKIATVSGRQIYFFKDMKVTFTAGKVTDIE